MGTDTFLDVYERDIRPKLMAIDVCLKTRRAAVPQAEAARMLGISEAALTAHMAALNLTRLNHAAVLAILPRADSPVGRLFRREVERGSPPTYTPADVAYIYNYPIIQTRAAFNALGLAVATAATLPLVFARLPSGSWI